MTQTVLITGSHGKFGHNALEAFQAAGWDVRRYRRGQDDLKHCATGADVIINAAAPPTYDKWEQELLPLHDKVITVAQETGSTVIVPGNVYVFGPDAPTPWHSGTPHLAQNPLGRLRQDMEERYAASGVQTIILRCGDFIDHAPTGNWFDRMITPKAMQGVIRYPGNPAIPHAWAYLPDAARVAVALAERRADLPRHTDLAFPGYTLSGNALAAGLGRVLGREVRVKPFNWGLYGLLRPVMPLMKGLLEMRYLWDLPHSLDGTDLAALLPDWQPTPQDDALRAATAHLTR